jgi:bacillopeptidase F
MKKRLPILLIILILAASRVFSAGEIAPELAGKISDAAPSEKIPVLIYLNRPLSDSRLKTALVAEYKTRAERHKVGVMQLRSEAASSQAGLINELQAMKASGLVDNIKSYWIINVVSADVAASIISSLADRNDVKRIFQFPEIGITEPVVGTAAFTPGRADDIEPNLAVVGADSAWRMGYTGEGRIVCSFDTGVEGIHPALYGSWKGHDGDSAAAWYDPIGGESFPHTFPWMGGDLLAHGSFVMGIMVGCDSVTDTLNCQYIGVAPGARWISAAVINVWGSSILDAFEWAADPDGDPNTIDDVPDVINHSWGDSTIGCHDYFWEMIDNTEALGIVNIFAAGNKILAGPMTIPNPADRAFDSLDCFAVGAIDHRDSEITSFSCRGPSDCDTTMIKPNVVAPGVTVRSSYGPQAYKYVTGTSFAAPHVAGAVAILRQSAPNATPDEIKEALLAGCYALPEEGISPNNTYGWGLINIPAALEALNPQANPDLRVYRFDYGSVNPGGTFQAPVVVQNQGETLGEVYGRVSTADDAIYFSTDSLYFGTIVPLDTAVGHVEFEGTIGDTVTSGRLIGLDLDLYGSGGYHKTARLYVQIGEKPPIDFFTHATDSIRFTISNFGQYGFNAGSFYPLSYSGFCYGDTLRNDLFEGAFMIGTDAEHLSDGARTVLQEPDNDFAVSPGGDLVISFPGARADQETFSIFDDSRAEHPLGLEIQQRTYSWSGYPDYNFIIIEYVFRNISGSPISGIYSGLFFDWNIHSNPFDGGGYVPSENLGYMYYPRVIPLDLPPKYRGISVLNAEGVATHSLLETPRVWPYYALEESEKFTALSSGNLDSVPHDSIKPIQVISTGPYDLSADEIDTAVFAIVADLSLEGLVAAATEARDKYNHVTDVKQIEDLTLPEDFTLDQNYPNPFNPMTAIAFALPRKSNVCLSVYNILGEKVTDLVNKTLPAGAYQLSWDGRDRYGREVSSGLYLYRLEAEGATLVRKMVLLK